MIKLENISHYYDSEKVLDDISFEIKKGDFVFLSGESGSGKSTLLSIMSTLLQSSQGKLFLLDQDRGEIKNIDNFRQSKIGFVFQFHYLIEYLNIYENLKLAALQEKQSNIQRLVEELGISELLYRYPNEISGGQRQRVALARALVNDAEIIFADEPTGSLDSKNSQIVYELLHKVVQKGTTVVVASHDMHVKDYASTVIRLVDGKVS